MGSENKISKRVAELIVNGTPRKKALVVCKEWAEQKSFQKEPILADGEVAAITESVTPEDKEKFYKWLNIFDVYVAITPLLGLVYKEYQTRAESVLGLLRMWEAYDQEENHLNTIYQELIDSENKAAIKAFDKAVSYLNFTDAKIDRAEDGYIKINVDELYSKLSREVSLMTVTYQTAKAMVIVTEEYMEKTKSKAFLPELVIGAIESIKEDYAVFIAPKYSRKQLKERRAKGITVTKDDIRRAIYPSYDELEAPQHFLDMFREKIKGFIDNGR